MTPAKIIRIVLILALVGVITWLVTAFLPLPWIFHHAIIAVVIICCLLWLIQEFGGGLG